MLVSLWLKQPRCGVMGKEGAALHCQAVKQSGFHPPPPQEGMPLKPGLSCSQNWNLISKPHRDYIRGNPNSPHSSQEAFPTQPRKTVDGVTSPTPRIASSPMVKLPRSFTVTETLKDLQKTPTLSETEVTQLGGVHCPIGESSALPVSCAYFPYSF